MRNSVMLIGRPGAEPETRTFNGNRIVTRFNLAVNETRRNAKNEPVKVTQWFSVVAWDKTAERVARVIKKGKQRVDQTPAFTRRFTITSSGSHVSSGRSV